MNNHVKLAAPLSTAQGWRIGTAQATTATLREKFGSPTHDWSDDEETKVKFCWVFDTPRGKAEVRDYWWNAANEQSIAANNGKAALWLARFLRRNGIAATTKHAVPQ